MRGRANAVANDARYIFRYSNTDVLTLNGNGDVTLLGNLYENSDRRLKKKIKRINHDWTNFLKLKPVTYYWKSKDASSAQQIGFIAQDIQNIYPNLVSSHTDILSLNYQAFVPILIEGVKKLDDEQSAIDDKITEAKKILSQLNHQNIKID